MARNKRPRKAYRPVQRVAGFTPITFALRREDKLELDIEPHECFERLAKGLGEASDIETIGSALNLAALCCDLVEHSREQHAYATEEITAAILAINEVRQRARATGRHGVSGDQHRAIGRGLVVAGDLRAIATRRELRDRLERLARLARSRAGQSDLISIDEVPR